MPNTVCKFTVTEVRMLPSYISDTDHTEEVILSTQYDDSLPEDQKFSLYTPSGEMRFRLDNPALLDQFKVGQEYYIEMKEVAKVE